MSQRIQVPSRPCAFCGKMMERKRYNGRMEGARCFARRKYCDRLCMVKGMIKEEATQSALMKRAHKYCGQACEECGSRERLSVHHGDKDRTNNSPGNIMTLCESCHTSWHWKHGKQTRRRKNFRCLACGQPARKSGLCQKHYQRLRKYGDPHLTKIKQGSSYVLVRQA